MKQAETTLEVRTTKRGLVEITRQVASWVDEQDIKTGLLTVFIAHTSASLVIQENADPDVQRDLESFFLRLVQEDPHLYRHTLEGTDDMPAHIRSALTQTQLSIPVTGKRLALGTWQGIYVWEHRTHPHNRTVRLHLIGES